MPVSGSLPVLPGLSGLLLLITSVAVLTLVIDRSRFWMRWWQRRASRESRWQERIATRTDSNRLEEQLEDWEHSMAFGEPFFQAGALLAPLLGLIGTVTGLMGVLAQLGPRLELPPGASLAGYGQVLLSTAGGLMVSLVASVALLANRGVREWQLDELRRQRRPSGELQP
jgi:biopolymer transport protein ExbB